MPLYGLSMGYSMLWKIPELLSIQEKEEVTPLVILLMKPTPILASVLWEKCLGQKVAAFV